jgi:CO dehydrogenase maturation factor
MMVRCLVERGSRGVLGVDADPNSCLGLTLGVQPEVTVAEIRDDALEGKLQRGVGMSRERAVEYAIHQAVTEANGFDVLTMGLPEGPSCYCAVNHILRKYLDAAAGHYPFIIIDCEAGMEHLSRRTTNRVDHLIIVAEATAVGVSTASRILGLSRRLPVEVGRRSVLWNKIVEGTLRPKQEADLPVIGRLPFDQEILDLSTRGGSVFDLRGDDPCLRAVGSILAEGLQVAAEQTL